MRLVLVLAFSLLVRDDGVPVVRAAAAPSSAPVVVTRAVTSDALSPYLMLAAESATRQAGIAELKRGQQRAQAGDAAGAVRAYESAADVFPGIADWAYLLGAEAAASAGDVATVERLLSKTERTLAREWGWRARVGAARESGDVGTARRLLIATIDSIEDASVRAEAAKRLGDLELQANNPAAARAAYMRAIEVAPGSMHALDAARAMSARSDLTPDEHRALGLLWLRHGNRDRALSGLDAYLKSGRGTAVQRAEARLAAARSYFDARRYADAERRLISLSTETGAPNVAAEALFLAGRAQFRQNKTTAARATLLSVPEKFPGTRAAAEALYTVADLDHDAGKLTSARSLYRRAMQANPASEAAGEAAMRLGGLEFAERRYKEAAAIFQDYRTHHPQGRRFQQATFWAGRAVEASGDRAGGAELFREALALDPASYYGIRAADQLPDAEWQGMLAPAPATDARGALETSGAFTRLDLLNELELTRAAGHEMTRLKRYFRGRPGGYYALAEGYLARGEIFTGISLGREIQRAEGGWNERLLRVIYPFPFRESIQQYARQRGIDPNLVAGLIRQESMFNPTARSSAGAIGLMQVMPPTGRSLAKREGASFAPTKLREPTFNIRLGTLFMKDMLSRYDGRLTYVLAAYNAGPSRVAKWRNMPEARDPDLFAERIPFAETRDYVKIVQQNAGIYRALYGG